MISQNEMELLNLLELEHKQRIANKNKYNWEEKARPNQKLPVGDWKIWLILAGRGFGKTRTGSESIKQLITQGYKRICLLGDTELDVCNVMIKGESGLLNVYDASDKPILTKTDRCLKWKNGAEAMIASATAYEQLRGPQFDCAWVDEFAKFPDPKAAFEQLLLALRLNATNGQQPKMIITTTPKPLPILKELIERDDVFVTYGSTFDNKENLSQSYLTAVDKTFSNSKFGAQELFGQIVEEDEFAFCAEKHIKFFKYKPEDCVKVVIAVDPATSNKGDETGIVVCGLLDDGNFVVLDDQSGLYTPSQWAAKSVELYKNYQADFIVAEVNQGGDMVETLIRQVDRNVSYKKVYATRGKMIRAQPIAALYEQGKVYLADDFPLLKEQMLTSKHSHSPDRLDAMVWGLTSLIDYSDKSDEFFIFNG